MIAKDRARVIVRLDEFGLAAYGPIGRNDAVVPLPGRGQPRYRGCYEGGRGRSTPPSRKSALVGQASRASKADYGAELWADVSERRPYR